MLSKSSINDNGILMGKVDAIKLLCFDLDGTLVNSVPDLRLALNAMLDEHQLAHCADTEIQNWVGKGIPKLVERALEHVAENNDWQLFFAQALSSFEKHYQYYLYSASALYPGVAQTLPILKERGYKIALVSNQPEQFLPGLLQGFNIADYFDLLIGGDTLSQSKPDAMPVNFACDYFQVSKAQTVMIGDSANDILAGQNAKVQTIAVTYGYNYGEPLATLNPDYIINEFNELLQLL